MNKKSWFKLGLVATALLLIPRRSSQQSHIILPKKPSNNPDSVDTVSKQDDAQPRQTS